MGSVRSCNHCEIEALAVDHYFKRACPACGKEMELVGMHVAAEPENAPTTKLGPVVFAPPETIAEICSQGPSEIGNSTVAAWLTCPEQSRLRAAGVRPKQRKVEVDGLVAPLNDLDFGSLYHALSATRSVHGMEWALEYLNFCLKPQIAAEDYLKAFHMLKMNDIAFPLLVDKEQFEIIGVEATVCTQLIGLDGAKLTRTARYDKVISIEDKMRGRGVYSLELKTSAKGGESVITQYTPQRVYQVGIWNANNALVQAYGPMHGTIFEVVTKTEIPKAERFGPYYTSKHQTRLALDYMRLPDAIGYPIMPDGTYPRMIHACWGRYKPCPYVNLCWENAIGDYTWPEQKQ